MALQMAVGAVGEAVVCGAGWAAIECTKMESVEVECTDDLHDMLQAELCIYFWLVLGAATLAGAMEYWCVLLGASVASTGFLAYACHRDPVWLLVTIASACLGPVALVPCWAYKVSVQGLFVSDFAPVVAAVQRRRRTWAAGAAALWLVTGDFFWAQVLVALAAAAWFFWVMDSPHVGVYKLVLAQHLYVGGAACATALAVAFSAARPSIAVMAAVVAADGWCMATAWATMCPWRVIRAAQK